MAEKTPEQLHAEESERVARDEEARVKRHLAADEFVVVAPYVTLKVRDDAGGSVMKGLLEGGTFRKDEVDPDNLRHHVETRLVAAKDSDEARFAAPAGTPKPGEPPNVPVTEHPVGALPFDERQRRQQAAAADAEKAARSRQSPKG
jgi:hypothetical protein